MFGVNGGTSTREPSPDVQSFERQTCCLLDDGLRCTLQAGNASYSKRIQKTVAQKRLKLQLDQNVRHIYICDHHKNVIQSARTKRNRRDSEEDSNEAETDGCEINLHNLQLNTLRRYKRHYKLQAKPGMTKSQLADMLMQHFKTLPADEKETLTFFIYMVKTNRNKLDHRTNGSDIS